MTLRLKTSVASGKWLPVIKSSPGSRRQIHRALALMHARGRYAIYWNAVHRSSGHAWPGRYYSYPLDQVHLWEALRYTELNPVRAGALITGGISPCVPRSGAGASIRSLEEQHLDDQAGEAQ